MVIVKLKGGMGNQMFQYAAGCRLAHHHRTELKLDLSYLESGQDGCVRREYALDHLCINAGVASEAEVNDLLSPRSGWLKPQGGGRDRGRTGGGDSSLQVFRERHFHFDPDVLRLPDNTYLDGYWQSERYFEDCKQIIRDEFKFKSPMVGESVELAELIQSTNSVSIHVRRGDMANDPRVKAIHGVCEPSYYQQAVSKIEKSVQDPCFFLFSDDVEWVRNNLSIGREFTPIDNGVDKAYADLRLMSLCQNHILANSTFSWWGAWLCQNRSKKVIAPRKWLNVTKRDTSDVLPDSWLKL